QDGRRQSVSGRGGGGPLSAPFCATCVLLLAATSGACAADFKINPTSVEPGEISLEENSAAVAERGRSTDSSQAHFLELGYGVTQYWWTEVEGHFESGTDGLRFRTVDFENAIRLTRQSGYWPESAIFLEYDAPVIGSSPEGATLGGLFREELGRSSTTINVLLDREFGRNAAPGTQLTYTGMSVWTVLPEISPGVRFFGAPGRVANFNRLGAQDQRIGPALAGDIEIEGAGQFSYNIAYLVGLTPAAPHGTVVWGLEYDIRF
ncbi:MAG TPA: hypothetical protein VLX85_08755, partial [Stellaceae bacterium]|nr:hypothetical protein [Stellaceae bacterium]